MNLSLAKATAWVLYHLVFLSITGSLFHLLQCQTTVNIHLEFHPQVAIYFPSSRQIWILNKISRWNSHKFGHKIYTKLRFFLRKPRKLQLSTITRKFVLPRKLNCSNIAILHTQLSCKQLRSLLESQFLACFNDFITFVNFSTQKAAPSTPPPHRGVGTEFIFNKCGLRDEDVSKILG